jgi:signal transduction histidine kinase/ActR/RegA family two-component response regulator
MPPRTAWGHLSLRAKGVAILVILLVPLFGALGLFKAQANADAAADATITEARQTREAAETLLSIAIDAETGIRGYVATGNRVFLAPFEEAQADMDNLAVLAERSRLSDEALELLQGQYELLLSLEAKGPSLSPARREALLLEGKENLDTLRDLVAEHNVGVNAEIRTALEDRERLHERTDLILLLGLIGGVLAGSLAITLFVREIAGRIRLLQENSRRLSGADPLAPIRGSDEIGALGRVLEETRRSLQEKEISRRGAEIEMARSRDEAHRANRAKSEFLSRMSHELRTPLNAILGFGQLLEMDHLDDDQKDSVEQIVKGGRHLLDLINEVLDISRIEAQQLSLSLEPVGVVLVVKEAIDLMEPLAKNRQIRLTASIPAELMNSHVKADRQRLKQVILNLVSNAIKYNKPGGSVSVAVSDLGDRLGIEVTDTGLGLSEKDLGSLFTPFERLGAETSDVEGTGLGLSLSKRLAEVMGADITVTSELGVGSTFVLALEKTDALGEVGDLPFGPPLAAADVGVDAKVLYIEDNLSNLKLVESILKHRPGIELMSAMQGRFGVDIAREHQPDLILLDINLPDVSGAEVLHLLQDDVSTASIPVVMLSADATEGQVARLNAAGATEYLTKPLDVALFLEIIDRTVVEAVP